MLKQLLTATAVSALLVASASAQSTAPDASKTTPPAATSTSPAPSAGASSTTMSDAQLITSQQPDQWVASKFDGMDVIGPDNEKVGDVSDILFDQTGQIKAYIVSVGGFLGMGAKAVALPPSAFQVVSGEAARPTSAAPRPATTGTGSTTTATPTAVPASDEKKLKISMTKDQLKDAANFEYYKEAVRPTGSTAPGAPARPLGTGGTK